MYNTPYTKDEIESFYDQIFKIYNKFYMLKIQDSSSFRENYMKAKEILKKISPFIYVGTESALPISNELKQSFPTIISEVQEFIKKHETRVEKGDPIALSHDDKKKSHETNGSENETYPLENLHDSPLSVEHSDPQRNNLANPAIINYNSNITHSGFANMMSTSSKEITALGAMAGAAIGLVSFLLSDVAGIVAGAICIHPPLGLAIGIAFGATIISALIGAGLLKSIDILYKKFYKNPNLENITSEQKDTFSLEENLRNSITNNDLEGLKKILTLHPSSINITDQSGNCLLHLATLYSTDLSIIKYLVEMDRNQLDKKNNDGKTPGDLAVYFQYDSKAELLWNLSQNEKHLSPSLAETTSTQNLDSKSNIIDEKKNETLFLSSSKILNAAFFLVKNIPVLGSVLFWPVAFTAGIFYIIETSQQKLSNLQETKTIVIDQSKPQTPFRNISLKANPDLDNGSPFSYAHA